MEEREEFGAAAAGERDLRGERADAHPIVARAPLGCRPPLALPAGLEPAAFAAAARVPLDVALWLLELRRCGDPEPAFPARLDDETDEGRPEPPYLEEVVDAAPADDDGPADAPRLSDSDSCSAPDATSFDKQFSLAFPNNSIRYRGGAEERRTSSPEAPAAASQSADCETSPKSSIKRGPALSSAEACCSCERFFWNPAYLRIGAPDPARSDGGDAWSCGGACANWGETRFRKLCQKAIDELHVLLNQGTEDANTLQQSSELSSVCPGAELDLPPDGDVIKDSIINVTSDDVENTDKCISDQSVSQGILYREVDEPPESTEESLSVFFDATNLCSDHSSRCPSICDCSISPEIPEIKDGIGGGLEEEIAEDNSSFRDPFFTEDIFALCSFENEDSGEEQHETRTRSCEMKSCHSAVECDHGNKISFAQLECMVPNLEGMEDSHPSINSDVLEAEYSDFFTFCDYTSSLIEETLEQFHLTPKCKILKTQQSHGSVTSCLSDEVFMQSEFQTAEDDHHAFSNANVSSDLINSIFDDGHTVPVAPPRKKKLRKLQLMNDTMSSNSLQDKIYRSDMESFQAVAQRTGSLLESGNLREKKSRSFYCEDNQHDLSKVMSGSLQNLSLPSKGRMNCPKSVDNSSEVESEQCDLRLPQEYLEVNVPLTKPVASFMFPSPSDSDQSPPTTRSGKQNVRCMSSFDDFISLGRVRKGSGSSDIAAWKRDLQRSGLFSQDDDYLPADEWFSSTDGEGRVYFFEENSCESSWTLPNIVVSKDEGKATASTESSPAETSYLSLRHSDGDKKMRTRARSMFLSDQKPKDSSGKTSSIPRDWLQRYGLDKDVVKYGNMNRTKITENGKKIGKKWASAYVVLTNDTLCFYKDHKSPQQPTGLQPEMSMQLLGARVDPGEKLSSRKHVFLVTSTTLQLLCECESAEGSAQWQEAIRNAISQLSKPLVTETIKISQDKPKVATIGRSKSMQVKSRDLEDQSASNEEQQTKIRDRLKKFFHRRPTRETLASKGIYKDEPVFDSHLKKVCPAKPPYIPEFVKLCIATIEAKEDNMKTDGLYRASGNLSHVQKIRVRVDQNDLSVLAAEDDVHVLTGALKLFFRELKEPLIPYELFNKAIAAAGITGDKKEKIKAFRDIVKQLPPPNHDTLKFLLKHLKRVTEYEEYNRMQIPNIAIVFGPTLMWRESENHLNMAIEYMQQNLVIEFFLQQLDEIF